MPLTLLYEKGFDTRTPALEVDTIVSTSFSLQTVTTENAVEEGADVSDHAKRKQDGIQLEAIVSDRMPDGTLQEGRARAAYETVQRLADGVLLDVTVPLAGVYENVMLLGLDAKLTPDTGEGQLRFTASFRQQRFGQSEQVAAPVRRETKAKTTKDDGYKAPKLVYAHTAERSRTILRRYVVDRISDSGRTGD